MPGLQLSSVYIQPRDVVSWVMQFWGVGRVQDVDWMGDVIEPRIYSWASVFRALDYDKRMVPKCL
uniref:Uncharacterized protein n=1 Tax=Anguilla anguilla TaxID=7936 RepID=A0A0E9W9F2_ANGAN